MLIKLQLKKNWFYLLNARKKWCVEWTKLLLHKVGINNLYVYTVEKNKKKP